MEQKHEHTYLIHKEATQVKVANQSFTHRIPRVMPSLGVHALCLMEGSCLAASSEEKATIYSDITHTNALIVQVTCTHMNTRDMGITKHTCSEGFIRTGCCGR